MEDENLKVFNEEIQDLLEVIESALLQVSLETDCSYVIDELFRSYHTIKGSAGLFGFEHLVDFTHKVENLVGRMRDGFYDLDQEILDLLLECKDHLQVIVAKELFGQDHVDNPSYFRDVEGALVARIYNYIGLSHIPEPHRMQYAARFDDLDNSKPSALAELTPNFQLRLSLKADVFSHGTDPMSFLLYLEKIATVLDVDIIADRLMATNPLSFDKCYLDFDLTLHTSSSADEIVAVFDFMRDGCELTLTDLSPGQPVAVAATSRATSEQGAVKESIEREVDRSPTRVQSENESTVVAINSGIDKKKYEEPVKVSPIKLEELIDLVGELVISNSHTNLLARNHDTSRLIESTENMSVLVESIRDTTLKLRMVRIEGTFNRFKRVVREVSKSLGKEIELRIAGGDTELDKTLVDKIADPLMHLVRNGLDHGIETPEQRMANGKSRCGNLWLTAYHESGSIVIKIQDDGRGLDTVKIRKKAVENGLIRDDQTLSDSEIFKLIFEPGFSTADVVTNLSGRGVGMDVVKKNIDLLRGHVHVDSKQNVGTTFTIKLPLTLAIIDGFLIEVEKRLYVIPLEFVDECVEFNEALSSKSQSNFINLRGDAMPFLRLGDILKTSHDRDNQATRVHEQSTGKHNIVIIRHGKSRSGLVVDRLFGEYQTVIKPLGPVFRNVSIFSGATILGSGDVAIILDVLSLVNFYSTSTEDISDLASG